MFDAHEQAVALGNRTGDELYDLFAAMGMSGFPDGWLLRSYRNARRALMGMQGMDSIRDVNDILGNLRDAIEAQSEGLFDDAAGIGAGQAEEELALYGISPQPTGSFLSALVAAAVSALMAALDQQLAGVRALVISGVADEAMILGDDTVGGLLTPGPVLSMGARWLATTVDNSWSLTVSKSLDVAGARSEFVRQAVAAIDERTTQCCLKVHGQVAGMDQDFNLEGDPWPSARKYGYTARKPPFHWWCRTSSVLVRASAADDQLTRNMVLAAQVETNARDKRATDKVQWTSATSFRRSQIGDVIKGLKNTPGAL